MEYEKMFKTITDYEIGIPIKTTYFCNLDLRYLMKIEVLSQKVIMHFEPRIKKEIFFKLQKEKEKFLKILKEKTKNANRTVYRGE
jgi:hypothetical protein